MKKSQAFDLAALMNQVYDGDCLYHHKIKMCAKEGNIS
jgi:hypothetical protein